MTTQIKRRRGTTTEHSTFTGAEGEITIDTTKDTVVVHDGSTAGGHPLAKESSIAGKVDSSGDTMTGDLTVPNIIVSGNVDGRDVSADGTKLDGIEAGATADQTAAEIKTAYESNANTNEFSDAEQTKLAGIEASADVTDTANVTAAGALMDSELTDIAAVKALNQGVATTDDPTFTNTQLAEIAATISDTAVDVFVYDTSKDSDGGAWRKRTQGTSWYNETLNTATRGSRREFPAVAVIVAESNQVTIYDGDDPDLPMWMVFNAGADNYINQSSGSISSTTALNGKIVSGVSTNASWEWNFISDNGQVRTATALYDMRGPLDGRNDGNGYSQVATSGAIVNSSVNDIAMTVLPNAPIDAATGLPVPTIAVATDGGVSVIRDDGTVVSAATTNNVANSIAWVLNDNYLAVNANGYGYIISVAGLPWSTGSYISTYLPANPTKGWHHYYPYGEKLGAILNVSSQKSFAHGDTSYVVSQGGMSVFAENATAPETGMTNFTTSTYNTGWQNGDIKLATLSDTDDTDVTGSELVTNGTFDSDTSGWSNGAASYTTFAWDAGTIEITASGGTGRVNQGFAVTSGKTYTFTVTCTQKVQNSHSFVHLGTSVGASNIVNNLTQSDNAGVPVSYTFTATTSSVYIQLGAVSGTTINYDNISVRLAEEDRSVNGNGLQVFGTVTKNPVATGADLVAYSGFSTSNYLEQPYNSDLDWGTSDFVIMGWENHSTTASQTLINIGDVGSNNSFDLRVQNNVYNAGYLNVANAFASDYSITPSAPSGTWNHVAVVHTGGLLHFYVNGVHSGSWTDSSINWTTHWTTRQVIIGLRGELTTPANATSMALWRISATAPSPEQIAKIYEDEKVLFQENAGAVLAGTSDAVTALAYDDSTELLHVGTSAGRSDFQGLRRVNNTTNAVGAAISASNGMIVEE